MPQPALCRNEITKSWLCAISDDMAPSHIFQLSLKKTARKKSVLSSDNSQFEYCMNSSMPFPQGTHFAISQLVFIVLSAVPLLLLVALWIYSLYDGFYTLKTLRTNTLWAKRYIMYSANVTQMLWRRLTHTHTITRFAIVYQFEVHTRWLVFWKQSNVVDNDTHS